MANCRECGMRVVFATTIGGRKVCLDPNPGYAGVYVTEQGQDGTLYAKRLPKGSGTRSDRHRLHAQVCAARVGVKS